MAKNLFCANCGSTNSPDSNFCSKCGYDLSKSPVNLSSYDTFIVDYNGILFHERKFMTTAKLLVEFANQELSQNDQKQIDELKYNSYAQLLIFDSVENSSEFDALRFAMSNNSNIKEAVDLAAKYVCNMYWSKLFYLREFNFIATLHKNNEADRIWPKLQELFEAAEGITTINYVVDFYNKYREKVTPYEHTKASQYYSYLYALGLRSIAEDAESYADRISSWCVAIADSILENAISIHKADYLKSYQLDDETKRQIQHTLKENLLCATQEYIAETEKIIENIEGPILELVSAYDEISRNNDQESDQYIKDIEERLDTFESLLIGDAEKINGVWTGGALNILGSIADEAIDNIDVGADFLTEFINTIIYELKANNEKIRPLEEYI